MNAKTGWLEPTAVSKLSCRQLRTKLKDLKFAYNGSDLKYVLVTKLLKALGRSP